MNIHRQAVWHFASGIYLLFSTMVSPSLWKGREIAAVHNVEILTREKVFVISVKPHRINHLLGLLQYVECFFDHAVLSFARSSVSSR